MKDGSLEDFIQKRHCSGLLNGFYCVTLPLRLFFIFILVKQSVEDIFHAFKIPSVDANLKYHEVFIHRKEKDKVTKFIN